MKKLMKKSVLVLALFAIAATVVFAAGFPEVATVEGKLVVTENLPTITSGGVTYVLPPGPFYQIAWLNGVKVGDTLKIEGVVHDEDDRMGGAYMNGGVRATESTTLKDAKTIMPSKVWVNGKAIDLTSYEMMGPGGMGRGMNDDDDSGRGRMDGSSRGGRR